MTIKELYDSLYDENNPKDYRTFINGYESNAEVLAHVNWSDLGEYKYTMRLICDYAISLEGAGYARKSIPHFDKAIDLIRNYPSHLNINLFSIPYYEVVVFHKARALYNLKRFRESRVLFNSLNDAFPGNDLYLSWMKGIKSRSYDILIGSSLVVLTIDMVLGAFIGGKYPLLDTWLLWILIASLALSFSLEIIKRIDLKKLKSIDK